MNHILFIMRSNNDIDHLTPIMYKLRKNNQAIKITMLIYNIQKTFELDYRIQFLKTNKINYLHILDCFTTRFFPISLYKKLIKLIHNSLAYGFIRKVINRLFLLPFRNFILKTIDNLDPKKFLYNNFDTIPNIIVFDQTENMFYNNLCNYSDNNSIVTIGVPHGHNVLSNDLIWLDSMEIMSQNSSPRFEYPFQHLIFENNMIAERYKNLGWIKNQPIQSLGTTRFSDEWMKKLNEILPQSNLPDLPSKVLKVVIFLTKSQYNINVAEVRRTIAFLTKFPDIYIIIKPHPRSKKFIFPKLNNIKIVDNQTHSPLLIDWADIVLFTMGSIIYDCLKKNIPALYLRNTHSNKLLFENYFYSWEVNCRDDLRDFIWRFKKNKKSRTYTIIERDKCFKEMLEPAGPDTLKYYADFIVSFLK